MTQISPNDGFIEQLKVFEGKVRREKNREKTNTERKPTRKSNNYVESKHNEEDLWNRTYTKT